MEENLEANLTSNQLSQRVDDGKFQMPAQKAGVYLRDWKFILVNQLNQACFPGFMAADFKGKGIYPLNACGWWLSMPESR
eukprot:12932259-Prorocentrum_lima.AAC.1